MPTFKGTIDGASNLINNGFELAESKLAEFREFKAQRRRNKNIKTISKSEEFSGLKLDDLKDNQLDLAAQSLKKISKERQSTIYFAGAIGKGGVLSSGAFFVSAALTQSKEMGALAAVTLSVGAGLCVIADKLQRDEDVGKAAVDMLREQLLQEASERREELFRQIAESRRSL